MRISYWCSDVCSSDLLGIELLHLRIAGQLHPDLEGRVHFDILLIRTMRDGGGHGAHGDRFPVRIARPDAVILHCNVKHPCPHKLRRCALRWCDARRRMRRSEYWHYRLRLPATPRRL